jgi:hypothetical protein
MVVMALVTTFMTTPAVIHLYPEWYQKQTALEEMAGSDNRIDAFQHRDSEKVSTMAAISHQERYCLVTMLSRIESAPSLMALIQLLKRDRVATSIEIHALRLLELTERASAVMKFKDLRETKRQDPVLNVLRTFTNLIGIQSLQTHLDFCSASDFIKTVSDYSKDVDADLILLPWINQYLLNNENYASALRERNSAADLEFVHSAFSIHHCNIGLFVDRGFGQLQDGDIDLTPQIIVMYRGGPDDRAALLFALRLQAYRKIDLTVLIKGSGEEALKYASNESIRCFTQNDNVGLEALFVSDVSSNVVCQHTSILNESITIKSLARPLNKHDLIIVGRASVCSEEEGSSSAATSLECRDYEMALGQFGFSVLKNGTKNASVLIIQAANKPSTSA